MSSRKETRQHNVNLLADALLSELNKLYPNASRENKLSIITDATLQAKERLPKMSRNDMVDMVHEHMSDELHSAMQEIINRAKTEGDYEHGILVEAFDRLVRDDIDSWTDE